MSQKTVPLAVAGIAGVLLSSLAMSQPVHAEGKIRIAEQFGITYLLLHVAREQALIEKHGAERGVDIEVEWLQLSGGAAVNDALLSGAIDIAGAGVGPLLTIWDRTHGNQGVKGVASLGEFPNFLITNNPEVRHLEDFGPNDRIAVPAVGVSIQSRFLQKAVADIHGVEAFDQLEGNTVALPHPDATAALISGGTEITAHFSAIPFQYQALEHDGIHTVIDSYEILGGPVSPTVLYATESYRNDNPETYAAFLDALAEAQAYIESDPAGAADIYRDVTGTQLEQAFLESLITDEQVSFSLVPRNTYPIAEFLHAVGAIRNEPVSWQDYFFDDVHGWEGS
ncbi:ABC transporter substrate-binding protein [Billgrantia endophytica]|uniref:Nitrate ABC transporter substrate-binding protein n=1 Tax=Billgrantia endophytica TaxID=2033802 RepID=A0A2N7TZQ2_9GAMM|nr:ABC transporter substrate-binding protein [Halomonas endophytica]PMR73666.1 nitrate ABC transporter substrate-binding protein [Halomonas endophytica]